ncbi:hypothetical protein D778_00998 [Xanthomarina gelatinilytica]|uniref:Uncharacterized protein n=1 Tax=Xanthomarina gelatinilytica TaxID=1137281 RepID=M7N799_9FLAO|nr:hypothetical protein D778_00998 [Xanthomarina gelatinilytica]
MALIVNKDHKKPKNIPITWFYNYLAYLVKRCVEKTEVCLKQKITRKQ